MVGLSDRTSIQNSWTLLCILADLNNSVIWIVSTRPVISKPSNYFTNLLVTVPRALLTIGITVTVMFCIFFNFQARSRYFSFFSISFNFTV